MTASRGFILATTLWVLAGLAILGSYIDGVARAEVERARLAKLGFERELDRLSTETTLVYMLATGRMNHHGLIVEAQQLFTDDWPLDQSPPEQRDDLIVVSDKVYAGLGETLFSIQDEAGLVSVNGPQAPAMARALRHVGASPHEARRIVTRMRDYIDSDGSMLLDGAEAFDYQQRDRPPPRNWLMASPLELDSVLGVTELLSAEQRRRLRPMLSMRQPTGVNFNTMRGDVMAAYLGVEEAIVENVLRERETTPIRQPGQLTELTGRYFEISAQAMLILPSPRLRVTTWHGGGVRHLLGIELTPVSPKAPWRKDYRYTEPATDDYPRALGGTPRRPATALLQGAERSSDR